MLDDITLQNLDVLDNNGVIKGTLLQTIDHCSTSFGNYYSIAPVIIMGLECHIFYKKKNQLFLKFYNFSFKHGTSYYATINTKLIIIDYC